MEQDVSSGGPSPSAGHMSEGDALLIDSYCSETFGLGIKLLMYWVFQSGDIYRLMQNKCWIVTWATLPVISLSSLVHWVSAVGIVLTTAWTEAVSERTSTSCSLMFGFWSLKQPMWVNYRKANREMTVLSCPLVTVSLYWLGVEWGREMPGKEVPHMTAGAVMSEAPEL